MGDDLEFAIKNMKKQPGDDPDDDFSKFEEVKVNRGGAGQKNVIGMSIFVELLDDNY
mgnify:CR=1 FL=1